MKRNIVWNKDTRMQDRICFCVDADEVAALCINTDNVLRLYLKGNSTPINVTFATPEIAQGFADLVYSTMKGDSK